MSIEDQVREVTDRQIPPEWLGDLNLLARVFDRSWNINPSDSFFFQEPSGTSGPPLKIATISSSVSWYDRDVSFSALGEAHGYKIVTMASKKVRARQRKEFLEDLGKAAASGAQLVCFPELAYPTPLSEEDAENEAFQNQILSLVNDHDLFVVGGSYHDPIDFYNKSPVFSKNKRVTLHAKLTSATKVEEFIRTPSGRYLRYYKTRHGRIAVLICLDAYEPSIFLRLMKKNSVFSHEEEIDVIFVPSFSPSNSEAMCRACEDLSYATGSTVVYVNCPDNRPRQGIFIAGRRMLSRNQPRFGYKYKKLGARLRLHEIDLRRLRTNIAAVRDGYSPILRYLIGDREAGAVKVRLST